MKTLVALLALCFFACSTSPYSSQTTEIQTSPLVGSIQVHKSILENGLKILIIENPNSPTFAYQTWFDVGSKNEIRGHTGLAHLFEHMMFKGTSLHPEGEFDRLLEAAGVQGENAFTSRDYTAYIQELPKNQLDLIIRLEADRMTHLTINETSYRTEINVVQNERRFRNDNNPDGLMNQKLFELAFLKHPYHWPIIGYQKDLDQMSVLDATQFYSAHYSPNHATIVVVGDVKAKNVIQSIQKYYGHFKPQLITQSSPIPPEPAQTKTRRKQVKLNIQVEKLLMGYHIPHVFHPDIAALSLAQSLLTDGNSSRLHRALVDSGIASSVDAENHDDQAPSLFMINVNLQKNRTAHEAEKVILQELQTLSQATISGQELERIKNKATFDFYNGLASNFKKALLLGYYETVAHDFRKGLQQRDRIQTLTALELQKVFQTYFQPHNLTVITGVRK